MSLSEKASRLAVRLRDPEWRQYGKLLLTGKMMGVGLVLLIMLAVNVIPLLPRLMESTAYAAEGAKAAEVLYPTVKPGDIVNPINTMWTLVAASLVFGTQVGFTPRIRHRRMGFAFQPVLREREWTGLNDRPMTAGFRRRRLRSSHIDHRRPG